jgi:DNA-binding response OmpR family regulator
MEHMSRPTILVVDDEPFVLDFVAQALQDEGYGVLKARDGADGLRLAREHPPALVITDVMMPRLNGIELIRRLKESAGTASVPIIVMSCVPRGAASVEANHFLEKPFDLEVLLELVKGYAPGETSAASALVADTA